MSIKQGLMQLRQHARSRGVKLLLDEKAITIPIYSFINQLVSSMKNFINSQKCTYWYVYFVTEHLHDRSFPNIIKSWQRLSVTSLECHLLQSLLIVNNKNKLKIYLKARKFIIQTASNSAMLDQILLGVEDSISVIHKLYQHQRIRKALAQGIKNIFLAFKLSQAKIYSSVFIQYLLTVYDSVLKVENEEATISENFSTYKSYENSSNYIELYSSISNFQSGMHQDNGLYKKTNFTHHIPKKYQIIDRKFIPLKETSQVGSNYNKDSSLGKIKKSVQKERSSFYNFISHVDDQQDNQQVSQEQSSIQNINNFSKSYEKQQQYLLQKQAIQQRSQNPIHNKQNNIHSYKVSIQKPAITDETKSNPKPFLNKQERRSTDQDKNNKNFSLSWFSKKLFQTSGDQQRQSVLKQQKQRMKKKGQSRKKLHITRGDSAQKYEIQNHILSNRNTRNKSQIEKDSQKVQSQTESVKQIEFQKMVSKNQQFKQKMLKKNYLQSQQSEFLNNRSRLNQGNSRQSYQQTQNHNKSLGRMVKSGVKSKKNENHQVSQNYNNTSMLKKDVLQLHGVPPQRIKTVKQRSQSSLSNQLNFRLGSGSNQKHTKSVSTYSNFHKRKIQNQIDQQQIYSRPQIIHKSIGKSRITNFSNTKQQSYLQNVYHQDDNINQQQYYQDESLERNSSFNMNKMKKMIKIIDNFRQNHDPSDRESEDQECREMRISESVCKKSNFDSAEVENYSFY